MRLVTRRVVAASQLVLSVLFVGGYFVILSEFIHGRISIPIEWKDTIQALLSVLTGGVLTVLHFWFNRSRPEDPKDNDGPLGHPQ